MSLINQYKATHEGYLPIRVLQYNIVFKFENSNPNFLTEIKKIRSEYGLSSDIVYGINTSRGVGGKLRGPFVLNDKMEIHLQETFSAYLWCICCSLIIATYHVSEPDNQYYRDRKCMGKRIMSYAQSLIRGYHDWDKSKLINPELYNSRDKNLVEKTNDLFIHSINFILCHEFCHIKLGHCSKNNHLTNEERREREIEADIAAIDILAYGKTSQEFMKESVGITVAICSLLFVRESIANETHPDNDTRIAEAVSYMQVDENDTSWLIACISINLFQELFNLNLIWNQQTSYKELFLHLSSQLE